ncbi:hypothetical protein GAR06_06382 [Micromonospora saelicesensis]|uniref:hypothetical protein n=1 Tax=Micromonospora saelicesensis TaxID=285676 RepID=UPI000DC542A5|nr:hypothetical protein [Micromonospora saelicesensis]RAO39981.1 hypothetical protein GAR06_06382 [Micromonospora saelicesensis]
MDNVVELDGVTRIYGSRRRPLGSHVDVLLSGIPQRYEYDSEVYRSTPHPPA